MSNQLFNSSTELFIEILVFFIFENSILFFFKLVQSFFIVSFPAHVLIVVFALNSLLFLLAMNRNLYCSLCIFSSELMFRGTLYRRILCDLA